MSVCLFAGSCADALSSAFCSNVFANLGMQSFSQNMDKAADEGVTINGISIKNDPEMQKLYKDSVSAGGAVAMPAMAPMPMAAPMPAPMAPVPPVV